MALSNLPPEPDGANGATNVAQISSAQATKLIDFVEKTIDEIKEQRKLANWTFTIALTGFVVLLVTVAGIVISLVFSQIQEARDANGRTTESLQRMSEKLNQLESSTQPQQAAPASADVQ